MAVYVDTSAWIALHEPRDTNHERAVQTLRSVLNAAELLVVGWHTLVEFADGLVRHYDQRHASAELERLLSSPRLRVESSEVLLPQAREIFVKRSSWGVDLSDCISFALMNNHSLRRVFTYDRDFAKAGFEVIG